MKKKKNWIQTLGSDRRTWPAGRLEEHPGAKLRETGAVLGAKHQSPRGCSSATSSAPGGSDHSSRHHGRAQPQTGRVTTAEPRGRLTLHVHLSSLSAHRSPWEGSSAPAPSGHTALRYSRNCQGDETKVLSFYSFLIGTGA